MTGTLDIKTRHVKGAYKGYLVLGKGIARPLGTHLAREDPWGPQIGPLGTPSWGVPWRPPDCLDPSMTQK